MKEEPELSKVKINEIAAATDPALEARIVSAIPLFYSEGAEPALDRPAHVRSASGIVRAGNRFVVIQDDANFIALVNSTGREVRAVTLPAGEAGKRLFDDGRGNKKFKMDLESCALVRHEGEEMLVAFGSGSSPFREKIVALRNLNGSDGRHEAPCPEVHDGAALYKALRSAREFAGSEMNIEAAVFTNRRIRLFNRGNGARAEGFEPVNASCDLDWATLYAYLTDARQQEPPAPENITRYQLGSLEGLPLGFTDATHHNGRLFFTAAAEDSPDAVTDGQVAGSALGIFDGTDKIRWTAVVDAAGNKFSGKIEGVAFLENEHDRVFVVVDQDSPETPSELCEVRLSGPWFQTL